MKCNFAASLFLLTSCTVYSGPCASDYYAHPHTSIASLEQQALHGTGASAFFLAHYYAFVKENFQKAAYWEKISAEDGYADAMYSYGLALSQDPNFEKHREGIAWLEKAKKAGSVPAAQLLDHTQ